MGRSHGPAPRSRLRAHRGQTVELHGVHSSPPNSASLSWHSALSICRSPTGFQGNVTTHLECEGDVHFSDVVRKSEPVLVLIKERTFLIRDPVFDISRPH